MSFVWFVIFFPMEGETIVSPISPDEVMSAREAATAELKTTVVPAAVFEVLNEFIRERFRGYSFKVWPDELKTAIVAKTNGEWKAEWVPAAIERYKEKWNVNYGAPMFGDDVSFGASKEEVARAFGHRYTFTPKDQGGGPRSLAALLGSSKFEGYTF